VRNDYAARTVNCLTDCRIYCGDWATARQADKVPGLVSDNNIHEDHSARDTGIVARCNTVVLANSTLKVVAYCVSREDCKEWIVNDGYGSFTSPTGSHAKSGL
jgi:hypothetical protein